MTTIIVTITMKVLAVEIEQKLRIAIGNHEHDSKSLLNSYMSRFNLTKQYYSFNYHNMHFLVISTGLPLIGIGSAQYNFVSKTLRKQHQIKT